MSDLKAHPSVDCQGDASSVKYGIFARDLEASQPAVDDKTALRKSEWVGLAAFVDLLMDPNQPPGPMNFPRGAVFVKAAGNNGNKDDAELAHIEVPNTGTIRVPLELVDTRRETAVAWQLCGTSIHKPPITVAIWYRAPVAPATVTFALRLPHQVDFSGPVGPGANLELGFAPRTGPPPSVTVVQSAATVHRAPT
jgi:hypothetical protein